MDALRVTSTVTVPLGEIETSFSKSGGPGGQNVNRRETQVEVVFDVAGSPSLGPRLKARALDRLASRLDSRGRLHVVASDERTQARNREIALERLRDILAEALKPPPPKRRKTRPSRGAKERRLTEKRQRSRKKQERAWRPE